MIESTSTTPSLLSDAIATTTVMKKETYADRILSADSEIMESSMPSLVQELETAKILHELSTGSINVTPSPTPVVQDPQSHGPQEQMVVLNPSEGKGVKMNREMRLPLHHQTQQQVHQPFLPFGYTTSDPLYSRKRNVSQMCPGLTLPPSNYCLPTMDVTREVKRRQLQLAPTPIPSQPLHIVEDDASSLGSAALPKNVHFDEVNMNSSIKSQVGSNSLQMCDSTSVSSSKPFQQHAFLKVMPLSPPPVLPPLQCFPVSSAHGSSFTDTTTMSYTSHVSKDSSTTLPQEPLSSNTTSVTSTQSTTPSKRKICRMDSCSEYTVKRSPYCKRHAGPRKCEHVNCQKFAQGRTRYCISHGGGQRCIFPGCTKGARDKKHCASHGGGKRCTTQGCTKLAVGGSLCTAHGGGKRCKFTSCCKSAQSNSDFCVRHGGGKRCLVEGCSKVARGKNGTCMSHATQRKEMAKLLSQYYCNDS